MIVLGIDPGQEGGLALVSRDTIISAIKMPVLQVRKKKLVDSDEVYEWVGSFTNDAGVDVGIIEQVSAMPRQGVASSFQFGRMFGGAEAIMYQWCTRQEYAHSSVWKKFFGLTNDKGASIDLATRLFGRDAAAQHWPPGARGGIINDGPAEAALIALYYIRKYGGQHEG